MNAIGRHRRLGTTLAISFLALQGCGGEAATSGAAATPSASVAPPLPPPPPAVASTPAPPPSAPAASAAPPAEPPPGPTGAELSEGEEHRHHHHGGVATLLAMSLHDLDLPADQKTAVEKIRTDLIAKMEPARAAGKDLANVLADGVAAGTVVRAKADASINKLVTQVQGFHDAEMTALDQLHAALNAQQRAALIDGLQAHWEKWKEAQGKDEGDDKQHRAGHMLALVRDIGLTKDQAEKIKAKFHDQMKANPQDHQHKEVQDHLQAFATAFKADKFSAKTLSKGKAADAHLAKWGATRMARFLEAAAPVLTADQRTKLAQQIRERVNHPDA
jgi:Spy/CpxP family protein refolding chaperone